MSLARDGNRGPAAPAGRLGLAAACAAAIGVGVSILSAPAAEAQSAGARINLPDPSDVLRRTRERAEPEPGALGGETELRFTSQIPPANAAEIRFTLERLELAGGTVYDAAELSPLYADLLGTEIDLARLFAVAADLQNRYREDGYLFTRVVVPAQRIDGGVARLEIIEAVLSTVEIETPVLPLGPMEALAEKMVARLRGLRNPTLAEIERTLLLLNDIPGVVRAAAVPKLGDEGRGAIDLYINMERDPLELTLFADNRQSAIIGTGLVGLVGSFNSWSPFGDSTTVSYFNSADFDDPWPDDWEERRTVQLEHSHFIGATGLRLDGSILYSESRPGDIVTDFNIRSDQTEVIVSLLYPVMRSRELSFDVFGGMDFVQINSITPAINAGGRDLITDDRLHVLFLGVEGTQRDGYGYTDWRVEARKGLDIGAVSQDGFQNLSRDDGSAIFFSVRAEAERTVPIDEIFTLWTGVWGQWANRPLLASEEMTIGGADVGRGFNPSEFSGDVGIGVVAELRYNDTFRWEGYAAPYEVYAFADWAEVRNLGSGEPVHSEVASAGVGIRAQFPGRFAVNVEAAKPINDKLSYDQSDKWRLLVSAVKEF